jgi:hypothetical protein
MVNSGEATILGKLNAIETVDLAIQHTRRILFEPFNAGKWFQFGVMVYLSLILGSGGSNTLTYAFSAPGIDYEDVYLEAEAYVTENIATILALSVPVFIVLALIGLGLMYLRARGVMMVIRAVAEDDERIGVNWSAVAKPAWPYFVLKLELGIAFAAYMIVAGVIGTLLTREQVIAGELDGAMVGGMVLIVLVTIVVSISYGLALFAMHNFIAPFIYHFGISAGEAWGYFVRIAKENPAQVVLFLLIKIVFHVVLSLAGSIVMLFTCCIGLLPVLHQTLLAPIYVCERAYSLQVLASLGPEFKIFKEPPPPEPPSLPPVINAPPSPDINHEVS